MIGPSRDRWRRGRTPRWRRGGTQGWPASWLGTCYVRGARCNRRSTVSVGRQVRRGRQAGRQAGRRGTWATWERRERKARERAVGPIRVSISPVTYASSRHPPRRRPSPSASLPSCLCSGSTHSSAPLPFGRYVRSDLVLGLRRSAVERLHVDWSVHVSYLCLVAVSFRCHLRHVRTHSPNFFDFLTTRTHSPPRARFSLQ